MTRTIRERVRDFRERQTPKLKQSELADKIGVTQPTVCEFETGGTFLGDLAAIALHQLTEGEIEAWECVRPDRREQVKGLVETMLPHKRGAA